MHSSHASRSGTHIPGHTDRPGRLPTAFRSGCFAQVLVTRGRRVVVFFSAILLVYRASEAHYLHLQLGNSDLLVVVLRSPRLDFSL